jgi:hypothetical protein
MSLLKQQNFLAKLYTDERLRRDFTFDPQKIGSENDLREDEIWEISAIFHEEINFFAASLFRKRLREAEKFLPLTKEVLKSDFDKLFRDFLQNYQARTIKKHLEDAREFCRFLQKKDFVSAIGKDVAKFEEAKIRFFVGGESFVFCRLKFNVHEIFHSGENDKSSYLSKISKKTKFLIWIRFRRKIKHFVV